MNVNIKKGTLIVGTQNGTEETTNKPTALDPGTNGHVLVAAS